MSYLYFVFFSFLIAVKKSPHEDNENENLSDSYITNDLVRQHSITVERRRHSSSSDPVNLSIGNKQLQEDSDDANIDVETISNAPTKVMLFNKRLKILQIINEIILWFTVSFTCSIF